MEEWGKPKLVKSSTLVEIQYETEEYLNLVNPLHLRSWFANCCYCTS